MITGLWRRCRWAPGWGSLRRPRRLRSAWGSTCPSSACQSAALVLASRRHLADVPVVLGSHLRILSSVRRGRAVGSQTESGVRNVGTPSARGKVRSTTAGGSESGCRDGLLCRCPRRPRSRAGRGLIGACPNDPFALKTSAPDFRRPPIGPRSPDGRRASAQDVAVGPRERTTPCVLAGEEGFEPSIP